MLSLPQNADANQVTERARPLLGTVVTVRVHATGQAATFAIEQAFNCIADIHQKMSFHEHSSELSHLNRMAAGQAQLVSKDLYRVLQAALSLARASNGKFDPTVAARLVEWGQLPAPCEHKNNLVGNWRDVLMLPNLYVQFRRPLWIDLGGIAKGYAVDKAIGVFKKCGIQVGAVNAGGDMRVFGRHEIIHVRDPAKPQKTIPILQVRDAAVASSAGYFSERIGDTALVNTITGESMGQQLSVTVVARRAIWADALTKIVMASASESAPILRQLQASALILNKDGTRQKVH